MPGIPASIKLTFEFGSDPNEVEAPENNFDFDAICAWTSIPITSSQEPVKPCKTFGSGGL